MQVLDFLLHWYTLQANMFATSSFGVSSFNLSLGLDSLRLYVLGVFDRLPSECGLDKGTYMNYSVLGESMCTVYEWIKYVVIL